MKKVNYFAEGYVDIEKITPIGTQENNAVIGFTVRYKLQNEFINVLCRCGDYTTLLVNYKSKKIILKIIFVLIRILFSNKKQVLK